GKSDLEERSIDERRAARGKIVHENGGQRLVFRAVSPHSRIRRVRWMNRAQVLIDDLKIGVDQERNVAPPRMFLLNHCGQLPFELLGQPYVILISEKDIALLKSRRRFDQPAEVAHDPQAL